VETTGCAAVGWQLHLEHHYWTGRDVTERGNGRCGLDTPAAQRMSSLLPRRRAAESCDTPEFSAFRTAQEEERGYVACAAHICTSAQILCEEIPLR
ncbi:Unknown protein, partial [Striga hermonthica]